MIRCLILLVTRHRYGEPVHDERVVVGENLRIGRGTDCAVHLPDPRVKFLHATIYFSYDGTLRVEGKGNVLAGPRGLVQELELQPGSSIGVGPYRLQMEPNRPGYDLVLSVELVQPLPDEGRELQARSNTSLARTSLSMRGMALGLAAVIIAAFLILPMLYAARPDMHKAVQRLPMAPDEAWNPGPMSAAHHAFASNCSACHQQPFVQVRDAACSKCHQNIGDHAPAHRLQTLAFGGTRCAQCHLEHKGEQMLAHGNGSQCVACHGDIRHRVPAATLANIGDFRTQHPPFQLTMVDAEGKRGAQRVPQDGAALEDSGLKFPHDVHLRKAGVDSPGGKVKLACVSCHEPDQVGMRHKPVVMQQHCAGCHKLAFEPAVSAREVPHGSVAQTMTVLREFYAGISIGERPIEVMTVDGMLRRPGNGAATIAHRQASDWAEAKAMATARDLIEVRVCTTCHVVQRVEGNPASPWKIAPVRFNAHWLPKARFDHGQHRNVACADCHAVMNSHRSADINIPSIAVCRKCHVGAEPVRNMVTSDCSTCHGFHSHPGGQP